MQSITQRIAGELNVQEWQVQAAIDLLDGGATVPFIARYRKETTGTLDDVQLRALEERLRYMRELDERRKAILDSIREQGKLTDALLAQINATDTKARLEDLYLPYKPKRRTKAQIAREAGLQPLADGLLADPSKDPKQAAAAFVNTDAGISTPDEALEGARAILVERFAEHAELVGALRDAYWQRGRLTSTVRDGKKTEGAKFADYFDFAEPLAKLPSHRILALFRGEKEEVLDLRFEEDKDSVAAGYVSPYEGRIALTFGIGDRGRPGDKWLLDTARWAWKTKLRFSIELDTRTRLWQLAEDEAVRVFAGNLRDLLLAAPAGSRPTLGLDPGYRTGVKVAVIDATGKVVVTDTIYPHEPRRQWDESLGTLTRLCRMHKVELVAIGNGTASRETDKLAAELVARNPDLKLTKVMVSEAGASVYSASAFATQELPDLDVSLRGAVSIARRLQDPLAELVKIDPKSIGVGQYQHDLSEFKLSRSLDAVVEDCVNAVGVDVNTASAPLLARVSGLGEWVAQNIVAHRDQNGPFRARKALKAVVGLGAKTFELSAGFLRIADGEDPLDASGVHPEAYPVVRRIIQATKSDIKVLIGNGPVLKGLRPEAFTDDKFGVPTVKDILGELEKPGRDPRPEFKTATFKEGVETIGHLQVGMILEGVVTNVAAFGAFVDIGVHQDGLVHISALANTFVKDPRAVVKPGDVVRVKVMEIDKDRKRIALTMRLDDTAEHRPAARGGKGGKHSSEALSQAPAAKPRLVQPSGGGALADALRRAAEAKGPGHPRGPRK